MLPQLFHDDVRPIYATGLAVCHSPIAQLHQNKFDAKSGRQVGLS
jgi:hypothetical protein